MLCAAEKKQAILDKVSVINTADILASSKRLSLNLGMPERTVRLGLKELEEAGKVCRPWGERRGWLAIENTDCNCLEALPSKLVTVLDQLAAYHDSHL